MANVDELKNLDFWESPESCVMVNPRSEEAVKMATEVEAWMAGRDDLQGCIWVATSGSSGRPRFVCLSKAGMLKSAAVVNQHLQISTADRWLCGLPEFHVGGLGIYARAVQSDCEVITFEESWNPEKFRRVIEKDQITLTSLVPTQLYDLVINSFSSPESLRVVVVGGEKIDSELGEKARQLGWPVVQSYGLTEAGSQVATEPIEALKKNFSGEWLEILPCWQVRVKKNRLHIKGDPLCRGYLEISGDDNIKYTAAVDAEGWLTTSDRVEIRCVDEREELRVLGRIDDVIKILGEQVSLDQLKRRFQNSFREHAGVADGSLLALPDERKGHRIVALIVADEGSIGDLIDVYNAQVAPYERIDEIRIVKEIPRTALGKVRRQELRALFEDAC